METKGTRMKGTAAVPAAGQAASRAAIRGGGGTPPDQPARPAVPWVLLFVLAALPAFADLTTSALTGRVTVGSVGKGGVTVTVTSAALQRERTTITSARGTYILDALPPGVYDVTFSLPGHTSLTRRAVIELGRIARADARLEKSEDEESVTSTATTPSVADTTTITTHFDDRTLDLLPLRRDPFNTGRAAPRTIDFPSTPVDDLLIDPTVLGEESVEQITFLRGALPVDHPRVLTAVRTRSGGEKWFLSLRDTITNTDWIDDRYRDAIRQEQGTKHRLELAAGGRIVPERVWFFASGWLGDEVDVIRNDQRGVLAKVTASPAAAHSVEAIYLDVDANFASLADDSTNGASLRYTGAIGPRSTTQVLLARQESFDTLHARSSYVLGDHLLAAGVSHSDFNTAFFAADRWSVARWTVYAGVRHDDFATSPRAAVAYDLRGNARHAIHASYGDYAVGLRVREAALGYAMALGTSGEIRVDAVKRRQESRDIYLAVLDGRYRAFDRLNVGGNYSYWREPFLTRHQANGWAGVTLPVGDHEVGFTVLQHIVGGSSLKTVYPTDVALRYGTSFPRFRLTLAADVTNVGGIDPAHASTPRSLRLWLRLRV